MTAGEFVNDGWERSAAAWIVDMGDDGDDSRAFVLDAPMLARVRGTSFVDALDAGCGEGRFCRLLAANGIRAIGIDPTEALVRQARARDPRGEYRLGRAEALDFPDARFDLVVSYLTLIDIPDATAAIREMARVLRPGGTLLIANLNAFNTAPVDGAWTRDYFAERADWVEWRGIKIQNWHRPFAYYMTALLATGLRLRHFEEPEPAGGDPAFAERYRRAPFFHVMAWEKPPNGD